MSARAERITALDVSNHLDSVKGPEDILPFGPDLLLKASNFFHNPSSNGINGFLRLAVDFKNQVPKCLSEEDTALIFTTVQHPAASIADICDEDLFPSKRCC